MTRLPHVDLALKKLRDTSITVPAISHDRLGREVLTASAPIGTLGWLVFVDLPLSEALQPVYAALERTAIVLAGGLLFAALAGDLVGTSHGRADPRSGDRGGAHRWW